MAATIQTIQKPTRARALDTSGNNNHGQIYSGRALEFDGVTDYLNCGDTSDFIGLAEARTVSFWAYLLNGSASNHYYFSLGNTTIARGFFSLRQNTDYLVFTDNELNSQAGINLNTTNAAMLNSWNYLVVTYDGSTSVKVYVNGVIDTTITTAGTLATDQGGDTIIGARNSSGSGDGTTVANHLNCNLANFQIWNVAWSADDVMYAYFNPEQLALNRGGTSLTESNLKLWYPMQDGHRGQQSFILDGANTGLGDEMIVDGDFPNGDNWTLQADWSISGGKAHVDCSVTRALSKSSFPVTSGTTYIMSLDVSNYVAGTLQMQFDGQIIGSTGSDGNWYAYVTSTQTNPVLYLYAINTTELSVTNVSLKPVNDKNHATTVFYGDELNTEQNAISPTGITEANDVSGWAATGTWGGQALTSSTADAHTGLGTYHFHAKASANNDRLKEEITIVAGRTYYVSYYYKVLNGDSGSALKIRGGSTDEGIEYFQSIVTTGSWTQGTHTFVATGTTLYFQLWEDGGDNDAEFYFDFLSVKEVGTATGWTDADQQLDIPQTALQSYNQLAWFDQYDDTVIIADTTNDNDDIFDGGGSISAWIYPIDLGENNYGRIVDKSSNVSGEGGYHLALKSESGSTSNIQFARGHDGTDGVWTFDARYITYGKWQHIVIVYDDDVVGNNPVMYLNGESKTITETATPVGNEETDASQALTIGNRSGATDRTFAGCITEVSMWNTELSLAEVQELYNDGKALDATTHSEKANLKGYWRNNGLATWTDLKGTNNGTPTNVTETILIPAGVDGSRDNQGFLMNRQKDTNALNLPDIGGVLYDLSVNNYASLYDNPITLTNTFSVSMWVKIHRYRAGMNSIISLADDDNNLFSMGVIATGKLIGSMKNSTAGLSRWKIASSSTDLEVGKWAHIVCCISTGVSTGNNSATLLDSNNPWIAGELVGGRVWDDTDSAYHADIDANTAGEVTGALVLDSDDSTSNDWDTNDKYIINKMYLNNTNEVCDGSETTSSWNDTDEDDSYFIGTDNASQQQFIGLIDDLLIYENKWLTQKEVTRIYNAGKRSHR